MASCEFDKSDYVAHPDNPRFANLSGDKYGRLLVMGYAGRRSDSYGLSMWFCKCNCGKKVIVRSSSLKNGTTASCGCIKKEMGAKSFRRHGLLEGRSDWHPLYASWAGMRQRCSNPKNPAYKNYGGRGISVCERWNDFAKFVDDMKDRPSSSHSIDRIDNDKGYYPKNCRWASKSEQCRNRRSNILMTHNGETKTGTEWSLESGISLWSIKNRIDKGWCHSCVITTPKRGTRKCES